VYKFPKSLSSTLVVALVSTSRCQRERQKQEQQQVNAKLTNHGHLKKQSANTFIRNP
jgi:hypothetical protein